MTKRYRKPNESKTAVKLDVLEKSPWESGFNVFKRRIGEQLQLNGFADNALDDEDLLPYYRMGESETFVLSALGCAVGV